MDGGHTFKRRAAREANSGFQFLARAQQGEEAAFLALYEIHKAKVYTTCLCLAGSAKLAEKLTRNAFVCVFRNISAFAEESELATALVEYAIRGAMALREERAAASIVSTIRETRPLSWQSAD